MSLPRLLDIPIIEYKLLDMYRVLSVFSFVIWSTFGYAQKVTVSDELPIRTDLSYEIIGELSGHVLLFQDASSRYSIQAFDQNMRSSWEKDIELDKRLVYRLGLNADSTMFTLFYFFRERGSTLVKAARYDAAANLRDSVTLADLGFLFITPEHSPN